MKRVRVAVFGTGFMGRVHVEVLRRLGNVDVVGVAGRTPERTRAHSLLHTQSKTRQVIIVNCCQMTRSTRFTSVLPTRCISMAVAALQAEKHVLWEKPLASTTDEAISMAALAKKTELANCTLYNVRCYPQVQNMRRMREAGDFGDIYVVQGTYSQDWLLYDTDWNWRIESGPSRTFADWHTLVRFGRACHRSSDHFALLPPANFPQSAQTAKGFN